MNSLLFSPITIGPVTLPNRVAMAPMCQYSSQDGFVSDWHIPHYASRAIGGTGLVILEATAVEPRGRISPNDLGLWSDEHISGISAIAKAITDAGSIAGIQLAHAGRKASTSRPFDGFGPLSPEQGGWVPVGPDANRYAPSYATPLALSLDDIQEIQEQFILAARRAIQAGFRFIELHAAHGYLLHSFLSSASNSRDDAYGGDFAGRCRFVTELTRELRSVCGEKAALSVRLSAVDWLDDGWNIDDSIVLSKQLSNLGADIIHVSSGGLSPAGKPAEAGPGFQTGFSEAIRSNSGVKTAAVGLITEARQAETILVEQKADIIALGRELLRSPYWSQDAASQLKAETHIPPQYARAWRQ